jgi:hypothetical protein
MTLTHHLGHWSALASTVAGAVYLLAIVYETNLNAADGGIASLVRRP